MGETPDAARRGARDRGVMTTIDHTSVAAGLRAGGFVGRIVEPTDPEYDTARAGWNGAIDRHPVRRRLRDGRRRRCRRDPGRPGGGPPVHCPVRRALGLRPLHPRRRALPRPAGAPPRRGRPRERDRPGRGRCPARRARRRDAGARPRGPGRPDLSHGRRRADARRRDRLAHAAARPHDRLAARGRRRARRRTAGAGERRRSIPTCSGPSAAAAATSAS